jgi:hypothetical protein
MRSTAGHTCAASAKSAMRRRRSCVQSALAEKAAVRDPTADLCQQLSQASGVDRFDQMGRKAGSIRLPLVLLLSTAGECDEA